MLRRVDTLHLPEVSLHQVEDTDRLLAVSLHQVEDTLRPPEVSPPPSSGYVITYRRCHFTK